jgi:hypothetical protein
MPSGATCNEVRASFERATVLTSQETMGFQSEWAVGARRAAAELWTSRGPSLSGVSLL